MRQSNAFLLGLLSVVTLLALAGTMVALAEGAAHAALG